MQSPSPNRCSPLFILPLITILATPAYFAFAAEASFAAIQAGFQEKAIALLAEKSTTTDFQAKIAKLAGETFGNHPELLRQEMQKRFRALPPFPDDRLGAYQEHRSMDQFHLPPSDNRMAWLLLSWDPGKLAGWGMNAMLSRQLTPGENARRALLSHLCPDKVYRLGDGKYPDLMVDSLGDLFVIKAQITETGLCKPASVKWMKKRNGEPSSLPDNK